MKLMLALKRHVEQVFKLSLDLSVEFLFYVLHQIFSQLHGKSNCESGSQEPHIMKTTKGISNICSFSQFREPLEQEVHT